MPNKIRLATEPLVPWESVTTVSQWDAAAAGVQVPQQQRLDLVADPNQLRADSIRFHPGLVTARAADKLEPSTENYFRQAAMEKIRLEPNLMLAVGIVAIVGFVIFLRVTSR